mgnify:CR=1 FL=1
MTDIAFHTLGFALEKIVVRHNHALSFTPN